MRHIVAKGLPMKKYICMVCGQVEIISMEEMAVCSNCGERMTEFKGLSEKLTLEDIVSKVPMEMVTPPEKKEQEEPPKAEEPKRRGRPPKEPEKTKVCGNCANAMRAINGLTCKETCESVDRNHSCSKHKEGEPIGTRYVGNGTRG